MDLDALISAVLDGEEDAWPRLQAELLAPIEEMSRQHEALRVRQLQSSADEQSEIRIATLERLRRDDFRNLRRYREQRESRGEHAQTFASWIYGAVDYTIREHLRRRYGRAPSTDTTSPTSSATSSNANKRAVNTLADRLDAAEHDRAFVHTLGMTAKLTVATIFEHIDAQFGADEARALRMYYLDDQSFDAIAKALDLQDPQAADKLIRKLNARLRYQFDRDPE